MAKFPEPPPPRELARVDAVIRTVRAGTLFWRIYFQGGPCSCAWNALRFYGPTSSRFDHHEDPPRIQTRGILYAAVEGFTCFAEVFQETRVIDTLRHDPWLVAFKTTRALRLLDLSGAWPTRAGASMAIHSGPRPRARRWSQAVYEAYRQVDGLWYCSSMNANRPAAAFYERARAALPAVPDFHRALADPTMAGVTFQAAADLGYVLV